MTEAEGRAAVVKEALTWLGTPWAHRARVKHAGVDCGQLLVGVFEAAGLVSGIELPEYSEQFMLHRDAEWLLGIVERFAVRVEREPKPADVILYRYGRCLSHAAIVTAWPQVLHAQRGIGVTLDEGVAHYDLARRQAGVWSLWP